MVEVVWVIGVDVGMICLDLVLFEMVYLVYCLFVWLWNLIVKIKKWLKIYVVDSGFVVWLCG